ncbi:OmpA family protein [Aestuariibius insulae]|uniref:OmpA family protein n=1 Tax=Aestuariibius insulae TaxID=2058287 RepID=UPI00345E358A
MTTRAAAALIAALTQPAFGQTVDLPSNAALTLNDVTASGSYALPIGPWSDGEIPTDRRDGTVTRQIWRIPGTGLTTEQIAAPLRIQLREDGWEIPLDCETDACGGFDFRFGTEVLPAPQMLVDLGDFRVLSARKEDAALSLFISRTGGAGYIQLIQLGGTAPTPEAPRAAPVRSVSRSGPGGEAAANQPRALQATTGDIQTDLDTIGRAILADLDFATGSAALSEGPYAALEALAAYLSDYPSRRIALVGHTDAEGSLEANVALSRRRAQAVRTRLIERYDIAAERLEADGIGYLSPIASNLSEIGRTANRRVEAILISTE